MLMLQVKIQNGIYKVLSRRKRGDVLQSAMILVVALLLGAAAKTYFPAEFTAMKTYLNGQVTSMFS